jgi:hypothetical protein
VSRLMVTGREPLKSESASAEYPKDDLSERMAATGACHVIMSIRHPTSPSSCAFVFVWNCNEPLSTKSRGRALV